MPEATVSHTQKNNSNHIRQSIAIEDLLLLLIRTNKTSEVNELNEFKH